MASVVTLTMIVAFLFMEGLPIFSKISVKAFIFGKYWYPTSSPADFGIFPLIIASLSVTFVSSVISYLLGLLCLFLAEIASSGARNL
jgi:phosphate transport system permease protein